MCLDLESKTDLGFYSKGKHLPQTLYFTNFIIKFFLYISFPSSPVGEPLNDEAWLWYNNVVGDSRCTVVDTWWQTG